jgi:hypothetical protein
VAVRFAIGSAVATDNRSLFISSCTRRELARRKSGRTPLRIQLLAAAIVLAVALGAFIAAGGSL